MGKYWVSEKLINQLQILLHQESGISSSDHPPPSPPPPSTLHDAISSVGSNALDSLRCGGCNGELLRGVDSIICVFCGRFPNNATNSTPPISFLDTFGFHLFLTSLSLHPSDNVERVVEGGSESGRGRSPVKNEIPLSALLDLQLKWPDESKRFGVENEPGKQCAKLVGLNLDELCQIDGSRDDTSRSLNEQDLANKKFEIKEDTSFRGQVSLSLFENTQTGPTEGENDESDWAAEFQSAKEDVKVESGVHMDSTHWPLKQDESANVENFQAFSTSVIEPKSERPFDPNQFERNVLDKDGQKGLEMDDASFDWVTATDNQGITEKNEPPHNDKLVGDNSSYNWDEFGMFSGAENNQGEHVSATMPESGGDDGFDNSWSDFTGSLGVEHNQLQKDLDVGKPVYGAGDDFDLFGHVVIGQEDVHVESMLNNTTNQGKSLGLSSTTKEVDDSFDLWNNLKSSDIGDNNLHKIDHKEAPVNDDSFDVWSDFAQSTGVLNSKPISDETSMGELSDFSSIMVTQANPLQSSETKSDEHQTVMQDNDDFGSWSDFRSSLKQPDRSVAELNINGSSQDKIITGRDVENLSSVENNSSHISWGAFDWSTSISEEPSHSVEAKQSESKLASKDHDLFLGLYGSEKQSSSLPDSELESNGTRVQNVKSSSGNDKEIDAWTGFTSSSNNQANRIGGSSIKNGVIQEPVIHDPFGEWNVISSAPNQESSRVTDMANSDFPQINISNVESNFVGDNNSMNQDPFLGMLNAQNGSAQVTSSQTGVPNLVGTENRDTRAGDFNNGSETTSVVDNLISEMHDLSFMLETSLSIPKSGT